MTDQVHERPAKPAKRRVKVEPEPGGQLEQYLIENKKAHDDAEQANEREGEFKRAIKAFLLGLFPDGQGLPDGFDIAADPHGRYPGYSMTLKSGKRFDQKLFLKDAGEALYQRYEVEITPTWELRESQQGRRR
jgi:hypothetical protein